MKVPAVKVQTETTIKDVSPDGDVSYDLTLNDASVANEAEMTPQLAEAMKTGLPKIKGASSSASMSNRRVGKPGDLKLSAAMDPQMKEAMDQLEASFTRLAFPFP